MASLEFPSDPTNGQTYTLNGVTYYYNSTVGGWLTQLTSMNLSTSSNTQVLFNDAGLANGSSGLVFNKGSGNLGIGTSSPSQKLHVLNTSGDAVSLTTGGTGYAGYSVVNGNGRSGLTGGLRMLSYSGGTAEITNGSNAPLNFGTNNTERMRITSDGRVGIGVNPSSPEIFHVKQDSSYGYPSFLFESNNTSLYAGTYLNLRNVGAATNYGETSLQHMLWNASDNTYAMFQIQQRTTSGSFVYQQYIIDYKNQNHAWFTSGSERMRLNDSVLSLGGLQGIKFQATQSASSDANTLDDYEEGTWTPVLNGDSGSVSSYTSQSGSYVKIGQLVTLRAYFQLANKGTISGQLYIAGFPFATRSGGGTAYTKGSCRVNGLGASLPSPANGLIGCYSGHNVTNCFLEYGNANPGISGFTSTYLGNTTDFIFELTYMAST